MAAAREAEAGVTSGAFGMFLVVLKSKNWSVAICDERS